MVDSNLQREHLLPSEKAFAYKMKLEALKHQGKTYGQVVHKSRENISDNESGRQVQRYIRLTHLIPELLKLVDEERIAFTPAVELSYLPKNEQRMLFEEIEYTDATPSLSQAQRLRKFSEQGRLLRPDGNTRLEARNDGQNDYGAGMADKSQRYKACLRDTSRML